MWTAELFKASRLAVSWCRKLGIADHSKAIAPAMCGVAIDVPLKFAYELSLAFVHERVFVPGALDVGFDAIASIGCNRTTAAKSSNCVTCPCSMRQRCKSPRKFRAGLTR